MTGNRGIVTNLSDPRLFITVLSAAEFIPDLITAKNLIALSVDLQMVDCVFEYSSLTSIL